MARTPPAIGGIDYRILGSLEVLRAGRQVPLGGAKQRAVLAILLLGANRVVRTDELIDALWTEIPPGKPQTAVQGYISQLRKILDPDHPFEVIITEAAGYRLPAGQDDLDLFRLESRLRRGREALDGGHADAASRTFTEALALFRGPPLADFIYEDWAQVEIGRLEEMRLTCLEERIEADLRLGRHGELVGEIEALVAARPLRERIRAHLMLALYRSGRQSEALGAYQEARRALVEEFGIEPTRALQELERRILLQDPSLDLEPAPRHLAESAGALTLLFTDIEGSTRLIHRLGDSYAGVLLEHRRLLRETFEAHRGRIVDSHGDSFFASFERPAAAAEAAAAAQRALSSHQWPGGVQLKVRIGLHTGNPVVVADGLVGLDVHRAARICEAAYGGQVLLSRETAELLGQEGPSEIDIQDLGEHALRDLTEPEHLFQLVVPGLPGSFPPPRSDPQSAEPVPDRSILVIPHEGAAAQRLVEVAVPLARSQAPHELIVAQLVEPGGRTAAKVEDSLVRATFDLQTVRVGLVESGITARVAVFTSSSAGQDIVRLASEQDVDLLLLSAPEGLEDGPLEPELAFVFANAPCDVAICLLRGGGREEGDLVLVPFGGSAHDWAALELGAWMASADGSRLRLLGVMSDPETGKRDASRLLAAASLAVQRLTGVSTEPALFPPGPEGLLRASEDAARVVAGVPEDWRDRGLGPVRAALSRSGLANTLFVRRGVRPGGIAPRDSLTRFTWSLAHHGSPAPPENGREAKTVAP